MDVVYNHTNEADDKYPYTTSFRGIDNKVSHKSGDSHLSLLMNIISIFGPQNCVKSICRFITCLIQTTNCLTIPAVVIVFLKRIQA